MGTLSEGSDAEITGIIRRASAWRFMYNPDSLTQQLNPILLGFSQHNRDGIACNGDRCDTLLKQFLADGFDEEEADRDNFAVRVSGPEDEGIVYNIEVCKQQDKLATMDPEWRPLALTLAHSHVNQILKNIQGGAHSSAEGIVDGSGRIAKELVAVKDKKLALKSEQGLRWVLFPSKMAQERPQAILDISQAANIKHGTHLMETEMQALVRLGRHCASETNAAQEVCYESVRHRLAGSMPKLANNPHFKEIFSLVITLGGSAGPWLTRLAEFYGQCVNPDIRKLRFSSMALLGSWPEKMRGKELAPLMLAVLQACYAADLDKYLKEEHLEYISAKDVKLDTANEVQMERLEAALRALKYFNQDWKPALAALSKGQRIQLMGENDIHIAQAFLQKDEGLPRFGQMLILKSLGGWGSGCRFLRALVNVCRGPLSCVIVHHIFLLGRDFRAAAAYVETLFAKSPRTGLLNKLHIGQRLSISARSTSRKPATDVHCSKMQIVVFSFSNVLLSRILSFSIISLSLSFSLSVPRFSLPHPLPILSLVDVSCWCRYWCGC